MNTGSASRRSPATFFLLVLGLAIPFWLFGTQQMPGVPMKLPLSALAFVCPLTAALILVYRDDRMDGVRSLLRRVFDYRIAGGKRWYVPVFLLSPVIYLASYGLMDLVGRPLPEPQVAVQAIPVLFVAFFISAVFEEGGYMGYAADPMQERWGALTTGIAIGLVWGLLHVVPDIQDQHGLAWMVWQRGIFDVASRVLIVWLYNNTGGRIMAAILFHTTDNISWSLFPNYGSHYDPAFTGALTAVTAAVVTFLWGSKTLARYRYGARA